MMQAITRDPTQALPVNVHATYTDSHSTFELPFAAVDNTDFKKLDIARGRLDRALDNVAEQPTAWLSALDDYETATEVVSYKVTAALNENGAQISEQGKVAINDALAPFGVTANDDPGRNYLDDLLDISDDLKEGGVDYWTRILKMQTGFAERMAKLKSLIAQVTVGGENGSVKVDFAKILEEIKAIAAEFAGEAGELYRTDGVPAEKLAEALAEAQAKAEELGLNPDSVVMVPNEDGTYSFSITLTGSLREMEKIVQDQVDKGNTNKPINAIEHGAFDSALGAQYTNIDGKVSEFLQQFKTASDLYENFLKVVSSTISNDAELHRRILQTT